MGNDDRAAYAEELRKRGLRVTASRVAVFAALNELGGHPDAEAVRAAVEARLGSISTQAVYDALSVLVAQGLARRIQPAGGPARFETRVHDNHHHLVCRACASVVDVDCVVGEAPCLLPSSSAGFAVDEAEVVFWGLCPRCQAGGQPRPRAR
ncbi:MAG: transcriptional repressor [Thermoleophilia bacterium]